MKTNVAPTSIEAYDKVKPLNKTEIQKAQIAKIAKSRKARGVTRFELVEKLGLPVNVITARVNELLDVALVPVGTRMNPDTKMAVEVLHHVDNIEGLMRKRVCMSKECQSLYVSDCKKYRVLKSRGPKYLVYANRTDKKLGEFKRLSEAVAACEEHDKSERFNSLRRLSNAA